MTCRSEQCIVTEILKKLILNVTDWIFTDCLFPGKIHFNFMIILKPNITLQVFIIRFGGSLGFYLTDNDDNHMTYEILADSESMISRN